MPTPGAFVFPRGLLRPAMLALADDAALVEALQQYLADGETKALQALDPETAVTAYVYWQAFAAAAVLRATEPDSETIEGDESETYGVHQLNFLNAKANEYRASFEGLLPTAAARVIVTASQARRTSVEW
jgi:hypothetical protein